MMTTIRSAILTVADELDLIRKGFSALRQRVDASRARDLIVLRRRLADTLISTSSQIRALAASDTASAGEEEAGRRLLSSAQSKVAMHQADWPAVKLNYSDEGYTASARSADAAVEALIAWLRQHAKPS